MNIPFTKMHGLGNDFVLVEEDRLQPDTDLSVLAKTLCDRHFGIGADGLIVVAPPDNPACQIQFKFYNSDGSRPEMCGNGIRCFARYVKDQGLIKSNQFKVETLAGILTPHLNPDGTVTVDMGRPILTPEKIPFTGTATGPVLDFALPLADGRTVPMAAVSMGNPHCILFSQNGELDFDTIGPELEKHPLFPSKTNVEFVKILDEQTVRVKVWERSAGPTLACGTGACAVAVAGILKGVLSGPVTVKLPGGDLVIEWNGHDAVYMTGPATYVFVGTVPLLSPSEVALA